MFHKNVSCGRRVVPCGRTDGRTDMIKLIAAFRNFANAPEKKMLYYKAMYCESTYSNTVGPQTDMAIIISVESDV
jgi:hypothetical protein